MYRSVMDVIYVPLSDIGKYGGIIAESIQFLRQPPFGLCPAHSPIRHDSRIAMTTIAMRLRCECDPVG